MTEQQLRLALSAEARMARYANEHYRQHRAAMMARHPELNNSHDISARMS